MPIATLMGPLIARDMGPGEEPTTEDANAMSATTCRVPKAEGP